jgi:hypothetical protein
MAILWVKPKTGRGTGIGDRGQQSFRSYYTVKSDLPDENRSLLLACEGLPGYGEPHPENPSAICVRVTADQHKENPRLWDVTAEWQVNPSSKRDPADQQKQPDQRREKWTLKGIQFPYSPFVDLHGNYLGSSAAQPFDPAIQSYFVGEEIVIQRYEQTCPWQARRNYLGKVNSDEWFGAEAGTALVADMNAEDEYLQGSWWWRFTYTIHIKPKIEISLPHGSAVTIGGWDPEIVADVGTLAKQVNAQGQVFVAPILRVDPFDPKKKWYDGRPAFLDGNGYELPRDPTTGNYSSDPVFAGAYLRGTIAFANLNFVAPEGLTS